MSFEVEIRKFMKIWIVLSFLPLVYFTETSKANLELKKKKKRKKIGCADKLKLTIAHLKTIQNKLTKHLHCDEAKRDVDPRLQKERKREIERERKRKKERKTN